MTEVEAFVRRFPVPGRIALGMTLLSVVSRNCYLLWLILQGELDLTQIILLILIDCMVLSLIEAVQRSFVPQNQRMKYEVEGYSVPQKLVGWIGCIVGVGGAYLFWIFKSNELDVLLSYVTTYDAWRTSGLGFAIGLTILFALCNLVADYQHFRQAGPPLVSSVSLEAMSRRTTFIYGALLFVIPLFVALAIFVSATVRIRGKRKDDRWDFVGGIAVIGAFFLGSHLMVAVVETGPRGIAAAYLANKMVAELLFAAMPLLATWKKPLSDESHSPFRSP